MAFIVLEEFCREGATPFNDQNDSRPWVKTLKVIKIDSIVSMEPAYMPLAGLDEETKALATCQSLLRVKDGKDGEISEHLTPHPLVQLIKYLSNIQSLVPRFQENAAS